MRVINKRYEVCKKLKTYNGILEYEVFDMIFKKKCRVLIFNNDTITEEIKTYLCNNFQSLKNFNFEGIYNLESLLTVKEIDGINLEKMQYGFISESYKVEKKLLEYILEVSEENVFEILFDLMCKLNTLNLNGFIYSDLSLDKINVCFTDGDYRVKLPSIILDKIGKLENGFNKYNMTTEISNREIDSSKETNIEELYKVLKEIFNIRKDFKLRILVDLQKEIKNSKSDIGELIDCFNNKFFARYKKFIKESVDRIESKIDIVGRELEISNVLDQYKNIIIGNTNYKVIVFDGSVGVGKTKILEEIKKRLEYKYNTSIFSISKKDKEVIIESNRCAKEFNYTRSFRKEFIKFMDEFSKRLSKGYNQSSMDDFKECYKIINTGIKLFEEHTRIRPLVLIIDDLEKRNYITKLFLKQFLECSKDVSNIMILITVDRSIETDEFKEYYNNIIFNKSVTEYKISMLNKYYTRKMVEKILKAKNEINEIVEVVYKDTIGNPELIMKKIFDMYKYRSLSIAKNGRWKYRKIDLHFNSISYLEEKYIEKIEGLDFFESSVLKKLAIYNYSIKEAVFLENIIITEKEKEAYNNLKSQNVIAESYDDKGINIDFKEYFYKKIIYKRVNKKQKIAGHLKFIQLLEKNHKILNENYGELIYHLEMAEEYDKMISYSKKYSQKLVEEGRFEEAINLYKRIFEYLSEGEKLYIAYEVGNIYERMEVYIEAIKFYKMAKEKSVKLSNYSYIIESSLNIAKINIEQENYEEAFKHMNIAKLNLLNIDYKLGYVKYFLIKAIYLKYIGNKEEAIEFSNKAYIICKKYNYIGTIGDIYLLLFNYAIDDRNYEMAEKYVSYCEKVFKKSIDGKKYYETLVNRAKLLIERDKNLEIGDRILRKILKDSIKNKMDTVKYYTLVELSNLNLYINKREKAKKYLLNGIELIKGNKNLKRYREILYEYLIYISVIERDISEIIKYKNILIDLNKKRDNTIIYALYYYALGDYENFKEQINKIDFKEYIILRNSIHFSFELNILLLSALKTKKEVIEQVNTIERFLKNSNEKNYNNKMFEVVIILDKLGYKNLSEEIFSKLEKEINLATIEEKIYLKLINRFKGNSTNYLISRSIRLLTNTKEGMEKIDIYYLIAENYEKNRVYNLAFENYYEGLILLSNYIKKERLEDRRKILGSNSFYMFLEHFLYCANEKLKMGLEINTFIKTDLEIENFLEQMKVSKMIKNKKFKKVIMGKYEKIYLNNFENIEIVLKNFKEDVIHNIESMMKYIIRTTIATSAILTLKNDDKREVIYTYRIDKKDASKRILDRKINVEFFIISNEDISSNEIYDEIIPNNIKSCLYKKLKRKYGEGAFYKNIEGELILMSDKLINNINEEAYESIKEFETTLLFLLDQYKITITSTRDKLTGAFNRGYFEKTMDNIIRDFNYEEKIFSLIIFDIDNFKGINDKFGHQTGDIVLEKIAEIVKDTIEKKDIFSRYGGEEFVIICPSDDEDASFRKAENIRKKIQEENILRGRRDVTVSLGVSTYPKHSKKKEELIQKADQALYAAKRETKNVVKIWSEKFDGRTESTDKLAGIITGTSSIDYERISSLVEMIDVIKSDMRKEFKLYKILRRILKNTNSRNCLVFKVDKGIIKYEMGITEEKEGWKVKLPFNKKLIEEVVKLEKGIYDIDLEEARKELNSIVKLNSICIVPLVNKEKVTGCLYLSVPIKKKEFDFKDYSYINTLGNILSILF
ncbi:MAG: diguanylate cyclase [Clostridium sp.]|uniref:diguanylate cyclase n=1 Tax=Clostridium sp. TaxID=1506 RepID=UPI003EE67A21